MSNPLRPILAVATLLAGAFSAQAAVANGNVALKGAMETICFVQINQTYTNSIDLVKGTGSLTIAKVGEKCNLGNGFTVMVQSANGGSLVDTSGNKVPYTIRYDNSGDKSLAAPVVLTRTSAKRTVSTKNFNVKVPAKADAVAGSYTDTITVSIAAR